MHSKALNLTLTYKTNYKFAHMLNEFIFWSLKIENDETIKSIGYRTIEKFT
jgi:hypothetical protein